jgi:hypothetical protein
MSARPLPALLDIHASCVAQSWDRAENHTTTDKAMIRFSGANARCARLAWYSSSTEWSTGVVAGYAGRVVSRWD